MDKFFIIKSSFADSTLYNRAFESAIGEIVEIIDSSTTIRNELVYKVKYKSITFFVFYEDLENLKCIDVNTIQDLF